MRQQAIHILEQNQNLNLTEDNEIHIKFSVKKNNPRKKLLKALLKYNNANKLNDDLEYKTNIIQIYKILDDVMKLYASVETIEINQILDDAMKSNTR